MAAKLGARVTGWGFVVFAVGSLAWCAVAFASGQQNWLFTNVFDAGQCNRRVALVGQGR